MNYHSQEVCGLAWSPDGQFLASGANDNTLCIWDAASSLTMDAKPRHALCEHQAAVKALAWSPHERNLLATGGGTADRCIKFWNAQSGALLNSVDTGSQVCALQWSPKYPLWHMQRYPLIWSMHVPPFSWHGACTPLARIADGRASNDK